MLSREKKRKKQSLNLLPSPSLEPTLNSSLPDDLLLSCLARVSRLYYPTLSLVSKTFRSLIASQELYKTRSLLNHTESCLYVYLDFSPDPNRRWYTLCKKPTQTLTKKSCGYVLAPVIITDSSFESSLVAVEDQKIDVGSVSPSDSCVIDNILYCYRYSVNVIKYYNPKIGYWMILKGLERSPQFASYTHVKLVDYGGKMAILMDYIGYKSTTICCAVISLERCNTLEIRGKVESLDAVLKVPNTYSKIEAFAITL